MLLEPTSVVLNSLPVVVTFGVTPIIVVAAAGDCEGLGWNTTVPAFGLPLY